MIRLIFILVTMLVVTKLILIIFENWITYEIFTIIATLLGAFFVVWLIAIFFELIKYTK